jgi:hypothetical protein
MPDPEMSSKIKRQRSSMSLRQAEIASTTGSDQRPREEKSAPYKSTLYTTELRRHHIYTHGRVRATDESRKMCLSFLDSKRATPLDTLFSDEAFQSTCAILQDSNEAKVIAHLTPLLIPSAQGLAIKGLVGIDVQILAESINEGWNSCIPITKTRPQPDISVGFAEGAFSEAQFDKLQRLSNGSTLQSTYMATYYMFFPFLCGEVKCGAQALDVADRQNLHSMTIAVRGVVQLFALVERQKELDRKILAFSISHDHRMIRIYGHYPVITDEKIEYHRHEIDTFDITARDGERRWEPYMFIGNVLERWVPAHLGALRSVIDDIPKDLDFGVPEEDLVFPESTGMSQNFEKQHISRRSSTATLECEASAGSAQQTPATSIAEPEITRQTK